MKKDITRTPVRKASRVVMNRITENVYENPLVIFPPVSKATSNPMLSPKKRRKKVAVADVVRLRKVNAVWNRFLNKSFSGNERLLIDLNDPAVKHA